MRLGTLLYELFHADWRHFFDKNGERTFVEGCKWSCWMHQQSSTDLYGIWSAVASDGRMYASWTSVTAEAPDSERAMKFEESLRYIKTFLDPDCRCRVGLHWKCGVHGNWRG